MMMMKILMSGMESEGQGIKALLTKRMRMTMMALMADS
jgi:hypothetical protein